MTHRDEGGTGVEARHGAGTPRHDPLSLLGDCHGILWEADAETLAFTYVSGGAEEVLGYPAEEWVRDPDFWPRHVHPEDREGALRYCRDAAEAGRDHEFEYRMLAADGRVVWIRDVARVVVDETGRVAGLRGVMLDITAQKDAERSAREGWARLRAVFEGTAAGIAIGTLDGVWLEVNPALARMLGYAREELVGMRALDVTAPEDRARDAELARRMAAGEIPGYHIEKRFVRRDGTRRLARVRRTLVRPGDGGEPFVVGIIEDVTEQRELEEQFLQAQKMEAIGRLAGGIAHDFNNLLTVIAAYTQLLLEGMEGDDERRDDLAEIGAAAARAEALTRQLLTFARRQPVEPAVLDLGGVVLDLERMLRRVIGADIQVDLRVDEGRPRVLLDRGQLEQVIMNLVVNARDAMPAGGTLVLATRREEVRRGDDAPRQPGEPLRPGRYACLEVRDTGTGMDEATRARACEPFFTTKPAGEGTGLGLSTVYGIVRQSGGGIAIESAPGKGTSIVLYFPEAARTDGEQGATEGAAAPRGRETVLLVEDDAAVRAVARRILAQAGYRVLEARDGEEALRLSAAHPEEIDLLVVDAVMPALPGAELAGRIAAERPGMRTLLVSGYLEFGGDAPPADGHILAKPFTRDSLLAAVREALDRPDGG